MAGEFRDCQFSGTTEVLDGNSYTKCTFHKCTLVYSGGDLPKMEACHSYDCNWKFEGAADRTIAFLRATYHGGGDGGKELIEKTFENIRQG